MHTPSTFKETNPDKLHTFIQEYPLGTLVTSSEDVIDANHIPFYLKTNEDGQRVLQGHIARANPLWKKCSEGQEVLIIFHGPNAYVSPNYYPSKKETGRVVPTWNYSVVHVRGRIYFTKDYNWILQLLRDISDLHEQSQESPWSISDAPEEYTEKLTNAVVGLEISIQDMTGNFKLSQNKAKGDYLGVVNGLANSNSSANVSVAVQMQNNQSPEHQ